MTTQSLLLDNNIRRDVNLKRYGYETRYVSKISWISKNLIQTIVSSKLECLLISATNGVLQCRTTALFCNNFKSYFCIKLVCSTFEKKCERSDSDAFNIKHFPINLRCNQRGALFTVYIHEWMSSLLVLSSIITVWFG